MGVTKSAPTHAPVTLGVGSDLSLALAGQELTLTPAAAHAPVTLGPGSDLALALVGQQLTLADVLTPAEHLAIGDAAPHHAAITLGPGSDAALALAGQQLTLADVLTPAEHTAIGNAAPHHAPVTIGVDVEHSLAAQVLSGVDAAAAQKGHIQLAGELAGTAALPTITATHSGSAHHAPVTLGGGSDPALALAGQQLTLADVLTPAEHTAIGDAAPHHAAVTIGADVEHSLVGQVLSGVDAAAAQKGHIQLAGQLGGSAASPDVRGVRETTGPTLLTLGAIADGEFLVRSGATVVGAAGGGADPDAIHDNVAGEIAAIAEKVLPVDADMLVIEDSEDGDSKKMVQLVNLPGGGGAPTDAEYVVGAANAGLSAEIVKEYLGDNFDPDVYPAAPNALDDEFEGGGAIDVKWTKVNDPAGADALNQTDFAGHLHVGLLELGTDNFDNLVRLYQAPPTGTATMEFVAKVALTITGHITGEGGEWASVAIYIGDSANDHVVGALFEVNFTAAAYQAFLVQQALGVQGALTAMSASEPQRGWAPGEFVYLKLAKTTAAAYTAANTYKVYMSRKGIIWQEVANHSFTFTGAPNEVGLYFRRPKSQTGTPKGEALVDFFRKVA